MSESWAVPDTPTMQLLPQYAAGSPTSSTSERSLVQVPLWLASLDLFRVGLHEGDEVLPGLSGEQRRGVGRLRRLLGD